MIDLGVKRDTARNRFYWSNENYLRYEKGDSNLVPLFPLSAKIDLIRLIPHHWQPYASNFCEVVNGWLWKISCRIRNTMLDNQTLRCLFSKKMLIFKISYWVTKAMSDILQKILESLLFLMSRKFETQDCQWCGVKRIKSIVADKKKVEEGLGQFFISSNSPHFFKKKKKRSRAVSLFCDCERLTQKR